MDRPPPTKLTTHPCSPTVSLTESAADRRPPASQLRPPKRIDHPAASSSTAGRATPLWIIWLSRPNPKPPHRKPPHVTPRLASPLWYHPRRQQHRCRPHRQQPQAAPASRGKASVAGSARSDSAALTATRDKLLRCSRSDALGAGAPAAQQSVLLRQRQRQGCGVPGEAGDAGGAGGGDQSFGSPSGPDGIPSIASKAGGTGAAGCTGGGGFLAVSSLRPRAGRPRCRSLTVRRVKPASPAAPSLRSGLTQQHLWFLARSHGSQDALIFGNVRDHHRRSPGGRPE